MKICFDPGFDQEQVYVAGYENSYSYFEGKSRWNHSMFGWTGHRLDKNNSHNSSGNSRQESEDNDLKDKT